MGLELGRNQHRGPAPTEVREAIRVVDVIDLRASYGLDHEPGVALVLDSFAVEDVPALVGEFATIETPDRQRWRARIDDVRSHGTTISLFFRRVSRSDVPIGSTVEFRSL